MAHGDLPGRTVTGKTLIAKRRVALILCGICGLLALSRSSLASDLKFVTTMHSGAADGPSNTTVHYYQGSRRRTEFRNSVGEGASPGKELTYKFGHRRAMIQQCDAHRSIMLDLDAHEYTSTELDDSGVPTTLVPRKVTPPDSSDRPTEQIFTDSVDTGERKEMFGYTARHIVTKEQRVSSEGNDHSGSSETDGWYIDLDIPTDSCSTLAHRAHESGRGGTAFAVLSGGSSAVVGGTIPKLEVHHTGVRDLGFPVKLTHVSHFALGSNNSSPKEFTNTLEVTEISDSPLDPALFEVPEGYTLVERLSSQFYGTSADVDPK